jgi:hypothetical protein
MRITRLTRKDVDISVTARYKNGASFTPTGVDVALVEPGEEPNSATEWTAATWENPVATITIAGPDASATDALVIPADGATLWIKVTDGDEVDAVSVERIAVTGVPDS